MGEAASAGTHADITRMHAAWLQLGEHVESDHRPCLGRKYVVLDLDVCTLRWYERGEGEDERGSRALSLARISTVGDEDFLWRVLVLPENGNDVKALTLEAASKGERDVWLQWLQCAAHKERCGDGNWQHAVPLSAESVELSRLRNELKEQQTLSDKVVGKLREELLKSHASMQALRREANELREEVHRSRKQVVQLQAQLDGRPARRQSRRSSRAATLSANDSTAVEPNVWPVTTTIDDESHKPLLKWLSDRLVFARALLPGSAERKSKPRDIDIVPALPLK
uniref:PH domain-containing protein n=1 Tax=Calcidiscus leptoporus TaxID=127549 RepID=A0A7S0IIV1_9EUKA|mmetsp:Transcript_11037/g.25542  ORF Transcript_11037/g.25542 Transcript_11037/m.25542 type:complete len:283 (+) Transcript_11037:203-1051(+)